MSAAVFVSYSRADAPRVEPLVQALKAAGLSVWWDRELEGGAAWRATIAAELAAARCVLVVWSVASVRAEAGFVHDEAERGRQRGCLLPVQLDGVAPPLGFGGVQSLPLLGWRGDPADPRCVAVVAAAQAMAEGRAAPPPAPPVRRGRRPALVAAAFLGVLLIAALAWLARGDPAEARAWQAVGAGDCAALATYLAAHPEGRHAAAARQRLAAAQRSVEQVWDDKVLHLPIFVPAADGAAAGEEAARAAALRRADAEAARACAALSLADQRLRGVEHRVSRWDCRPRAAGVACAFEGEALCRVQAARAVERSVCP